MNELGRGRPAGEDLSGVGQMTSEREAREDVEVAAGSAAELLAATEDVLDELMVELEGSPEALEHVFALSERVLFYLGEDDTPTAFAEALVDSSGEAEPKKLAEIDKIRQMIVSEVNPILFNIRSVIRDHNKDNWQKVGADLLVDEGLIDSLATGSIEGQATKCLFGHLEGLSDKEKFVPKEIVVIDPTERSVENVRYWADYMKAHEEVTGERYEHYSDLIAARSERAVFELDAGIEEFARQEDRKTAQAFAVLAQFMESRIEPLKDDFKNEANSLSAYSPSSLDMSPEEVIDLLSSAEVVKHKDPQLYARLLGIAPGVEDAQAKRSDLFGNAFQILVDRSLKDEPKPESVEDKKGHKVIADYLENLTLTDSKQMPLTQLNESQLKKMQKRLMKDMRKKTDKQNEVLQIATLHDIITSLATAPAKEFLRGISEDREGEMENERFEEEFEALMEVRPDQSPTFEADNRLAFSKGLAKGLIARGEVARAFEVMEPIYSEYASSANEDQQDYFARRVRVGLNEVVANAPIEIILADPDQFISHVNIDHKRLLTAPVGRRLIEAEDLAAAHDFIEEGVNERMPITIGEKRELAQVIGELAQAEIDAGFFDESREFDEILEKQGISREIQEIIAYRAKKYADNGAYLDAIEEASAIKSLELRHEAALHIVDRLRENGEFDKAFEVVMDSDLDQKVKAEKLETIVLERHRAGGEVYEVHAKFRAEVCPQGDSSLSALKGWRNLSRINKELEIDSSEELSELTQEVLKKPEGVDRLLSLAEMYNVMDDESKRRGQLQTDAIDVKVAFLNSFRDAAKGEEFHGVDTYALFEECLRSTLYADYGEAAKMLVGDLRTRRESWGHKPEELYVTELIRQGTFHRAKGFMQDKLNNSELSVTYHSELCDWFLKEEDYLRAGEAAMNIPEIPLEFVEVRDQTVLKIIKAKIDASREDDSYEVGQLILRWSDSIDGVHVRAEALNYFIDKYGDLWSVVEALKEVDSNRFEELAAKRMEKVLEKNINAAATSKAHVEMGLDSDMSTKFDVALHCAAAVGASKNPEGQAVSKFNLRQARNKALGSRGDVDSLGHIDLSQSDSALQSVAVAMARMGDIKGAIKFVQDTDPSHTGFFGRSLVSENVDIGIKAAQEARHTAWWQDHAFVKIAEAFAEKYGAQVS